MNPVNPVDTSALARSLHRLAQLSIGIAAVALAGLAVVQGWQVFARYVLNNSPSWSEPVTLVLLSATMSFAAAAAVHGGNHFAFSLLAQRGSMQRQRMAASVSHLITILIGTALCIGACRLFFDGLDIQMAGAAMPQSTAFAPLSIGGLLMAIFALQQLRLTWAAMPSTTGSREAR